MPQEPVPAPLLSLGREAVEATAATGDLTSFVGTALYNRDRDSFIQALPSYEEANEAICAPPLVATRYGSRDEAGERLTLQFVYQLFPRATEQGVGQDVRRLWGRFLAELNAPDWIYRGVANLRNFTLGADMADPVQVEDGVTVRGQSFEVLRSQGFNESTLEARPVDTWPPRFLPTGPIAGRRGCAHRHRPGRIRTRLLVSLLVTLWVVPGN